MIASCLLIQLWFATQCITLRNSQVMYVCCAKSKLWSSGATPSTSQELKRPQHLTVHIMLYDSGLSFQTAHTCFWGNKHTRRRWSTVKILLAPTLV